MLFANAIPNWQCDWRSRQKCDEQTTRILLTPLDQKDLSEDILLRLAKRRLFPVDSWQIVRSLFQARAIDPRLTRHGWIADALLESIPPEGYPVARGGFLDAETVWPLLLGRTIGLTAEPSDLMALLRWSLDADATRRFTKTPPEHQAGIIEWLTQQAGPVAPVVLTCLGRWEGPDAIPLGLAAGVVFHPQTRGKLEKAAGKLEERFLAGQTPDPSILQRWTAAATDVVRALRHTDGRLHRQLLKRADDILSELGAESFAHLSDTSPLGFDQRLARFGELVADRVARADWNHAEELAAAKESVRRHDQSSLEGRRLERVQMALRLLRWLGTQDSQASAAPRSLSEAAADHLSDGGFADWARLTLRAGDAVGELSESYARLFDAVTRVRERQAQQFARLLVDWTAADSPADDLVPVEKILEQFVAPLAAERPVLVIVIDGMSVAVCRELLSDLVRREWIPLCESGRTQNRPGLATIPSVTEYSRTSLLCGRLERGTSADEQAGFSQHPALVAQCRAGSPPVLFHKASLQESQDAVLAKEVRDSIQSSHRRVVGVVVNAVDDHLLKGDQIDTRWSHDEIRVLPALLHEARNAGRLVVLVSDHGHILDCRADFRPAEGGERWRTAAGEPAADEMLVRGPRVSGRRATTDRALERASPLRHQKERLPRRPLAAGDGGADRRLVRYGQSAAGMASTTRRRSRLVGRAAHRPGRRTAGPAIETRPTAETRHALRFAPARGDKTRGAPNTGSGELIRRGSGACLARQFMTNRNGWPDAVSRATMS